MNQSTYTHTVFTFFLPTSRASCILKKDQIKTHMIEFFCAVRPFFLCEEIIYIRIFSGVGKGGKGEGGGGAQPPNELKDHPSEKMKSKKKLGGGGAMTRRQDD